MESKSASGDDVMTVGKSASRLGIARMTLYRWIASGKVICKRVGGHIFIPVSEIERLKKEATED